MSSSLTTRVPISVVAEGFAALSENVRQVIRGKQDVVELALTCLLAEGHLLIEDVPGTGKTSLARSLAASMEASWRRIQFTPDLLPLDVIGVSIYDQGTKRFDFHEGPVFANIVLGDEINRASPKTQSALLEVMEEQRVTVDGEPRPVPRPFMVIATQNSVDMAGTYALPEAQLDRFLMRIKVGYPDHAAELEILANRRQHRQVEDLKPVRTIAELREMVAAASDIHVADVVADYAVRLVAGTRGLSDLRLGASPRGSLALLRAGRVRAAAEGREFVTPEDVKALAAPVLAHRLILTPEALVRGATQESIVADVVRATPVPHGYPSR